MRHYKDCYFCYLLIFNVKTKGNWELEYFKQFDSHLHHFSGPNTTCFYLELSFSAVMFQNWKLSSQGTEQNKKHHCSFASDISLTDMTGWHVSGFGSAAKMLAIHQVIDFLSKGTSIAYMHLVYNLQ